NRHIYILQQYLYLCTGEVRYAFTRPVLAFCFDMTRFRVDFAWIRSIPTAHVTTVACLYKELAGRVCMQIQEHENALSIKENSSGGAQLRTLLLRRNTFSSLHEFVGSYVVFPKPVRNISEETSENVRE